MKALIATLALVVGFQAQARSIQMSVDYVLPLVKIDGKQTPYVAITVVDLMKKQISVNLYQDPCGTYTAQPGEVTCMAMPILKREFVAPLQKRSADPTCGAVTYAGKEDLRPVDGAMTAIQVVDNSNFKCPSLVMVNKAEVTVKHEFVSRMSGQAIKETVKAYTNQPY